MWENKWEQLFCRQFQLDLVGSSMVKTLISVPDIYHQSHWWIYILMCLHYIYMCFRHAEVYGVYGVLNYAFIFLGRQRGLLAEFWVGFQDVILLFHPKTSPSCINCHNCRLKTPVYWRILWLCSISFLLCLCEDLVIYGCYSSEILSRCCLFLMINVLNPQCLPLCLERKKKAQPIWFD